MIGTELGIDIFSRNDGSVEYGESIRGIRFPYDEPDRVQPLQPRHHTARIVTDQIRLDSVSLQRGLRDVSLSLARECANDELGVVWHSTCLVWVTLP